MLMDTHPSQNCNDVRLKRSKINEEEAWVGPFFKSFLLFSHVCITFKVKVQKGPSCCSSPSTKTYVPYSSLKSKLRQHRLNRFLNNNCPRTKAASHSMLIIHPQDIITAFNYVSRLDIGDVLVPTVWADNYTIYRPNNILNWRHSLDIKKSRQHSPYGKPFGWSPALLHTNYTLPILPFGKISSDHICTKVCFF